MAQISPVIETLEHRYMRAWTGRDLKELKGLTAREFILLVGSKPATILDRHSWLAAAIKYWHCSSFRFGDVHVRKIGSCALFASQVELKATLNGEDWSGHMWLTDVWQKRRIGGWRLAERVISKIDDNARTPEAIKSLQLWR